MGTSNSFGPASNSGFARAVHSDSDSKSVARHVVQFYSDDEFLLGALTDFIGNALEAGDPAVVIATQPHREGLAQRLQERGFDIASARRQGAYVSLDAAECLSKIMVEGHPDAERFREATGEMLRRTMAARRGEQTRVAAFGEMAALLWADHKPEDALLLERLGNDLAEKNSLSLLCAYPMAGFNLEEHGEAFRRICAEHSGVIPNESYASGGSEDARLRHVAELQQKTHALTETRQELRLLSSNLMQLQDAERRRIARELHDNVSQNLAAMSMKMAELRRALTNVDPAVQSAVAECLSLCERCIGDTRSMSDLLHPATLDDLGLEAAMRHYLESFTQRSGIAVTLKIMPQMQRLPANVETAVFRIFQEALTNVYRHSGSPTAHVELDVNGESLVLKIRDEGHGMPYGGEKYRAEKRGTGIVGLRERAKDLGGQLEIASNAYGTILRAMLPLDPNPPVTR